MMRKRLAYVAKDVLQLENALFAVTQWTANSASRNDVEHYLLQIGRRGDGGEDGDNGTVCPLRTLIQRVLLYQPELGNDDLMEDPSTLTDACANLITTVLLSPACNICAKEEGAAHSPALKEVIGDLLERGRALIFEMNASDADEGGTPDQIAENLANCIFELCRRASKEKRAHDRRLDARPNVNGNNAREVARRLEVEISALLASEEKDSRGEVLDLLAKRDWIKKMAEKSGMVLEISLGQSKKKRTSNGSTVVGGANGGIETEVNGGNEEEKLQEPQEVACLPRIQSPEAKQQLVQKILGPSFYGFIASSMNEVLSLEGEIVKRHEETSNKRSALSNRQETLSSKRKEVALRMDKLRKELENLEMQDKELAKDEITVASDLGQLDVILEREVKDLEEKITSKDGHVAADGAVRVTVDAMGELEGAWARSFSSSVAKAVPASVSPQSKYSIIPLAPLKLDHYLQYAASYFQTEAKSIEFLRKRVSTMEDEISKLARELEPEEPAPNDMTMLKSRIIEDNMAINALKENVKQMRLDLIRKVVAYCEDQRLVGTETLRPSHIMFLEGIIMELAGIDSNFDVDGKMGSVSSKISFAKKALSKPKPVPKPPQAIKASAVTPPPTESANVPPPTGSVNEPPPTAPLEPVIEKPHTPPAFPKFGWGNKANNMVKKETRSFLDIQKEEMAQRK